MRPQYLNYLNSSFAMWLDWFLLTKTSGFYTGISSKFYATNNQFNGLFTYQSPYSNFIADSSITTPFTGLYINNTFITTGVSGLVGINPSRGQIYFSNNVGNSVLSGTFAIKECPVLPYSVDESKLLFETKFSPRSKTTTNSITSSNVTGLAPDSYVFPAIYCKNFMNFNTPYCFGGTDLSETTVGLVVVSENSFQSDILKSVLADAKQEIVPLLTSFPFDIYGNYKVTGENFNYVTYSSGAKYYSGMYIKDVVVNSFKREYNFDFNKLNPDIYPFLAEFVICKTRNPRSTTNNL